VARSKYPSIIIKKRNPDGSLEDFPPNQEFEIAKLEGCLFGDVLVGDSLNYYFSNAMQPVKFVVADSLVSDSGVVKLRVGLVENYESINQKYNGKKRRTGKYIEEGKEEWQLELEKLFAEKSNKIQKLMSNGLSSTCYIGDFITYTSWQGDIPIGKPELEILYPTPTTTEWITAEPKMPTVTCKAQLKNYNKGTVKFEWEYWVRYTLYRHAYYTADTLCRRTGMIKITETSNANNTDITTWTVIFSKTNLDSAEFISKQPTIPENHKYGGDCNEQRNDWLEGENIFIGGDVFVKVTAKNSTGKVICFKQQNCGTILGRNPTPYNMQNSVNSNEFKAIIIQESPLQFNEIDLDKKYSNFPETLYGWKYNKRGFPCYGVPNGYGLAQIDNPPPTEMDLWNWKSNVDGGKRILQVHKNNVLVDFKKWKVPSNSQDWNKYFLINSFHHYNTNKSYYSYDNIKGKWKTNPHLTDDQKNNHYGEKVYNIYKNLNP